MNVNISVVIPVYNDKDIIYKALDSLKEQTYKDFEVVLIDDGSEDELDSIVNKYKKYLNIQYFYQKNSGVSVARNEGIIKSKGKYITFLDSDDYYKKEFLEKMYKCIELNNDDVCYCGYLIDFNGKKVKKVYSNYVRKNVIENYLKNKTNIHTSSWIIKKEYIFKNNIFFLKETSWGEDIYFFCEILMNTKKINFVKENLSFYTVGEKNNRLSNLELDKIDKDYKLSCKLLKNPQIIEMKKIYNIVLYYRLPALIINKLYLLLKCKTNEKLLYEYYNKYKIHINKIYFINGLRSFKIYILKSYLKIYFNNKKARG